MLDASGLVYNHNKTLGMLESNKEDNPVAAQILGDDPSETLEACHIVLQRAKPVFIDLNFACPVRKVIKKKAGAYLLRYPKKAGKIVKKLASSLPLPVTVKIRSAYYDKDPKAGLLLAKTAQENGASAVFIHGRTAQQGYSGRVNYEAIKSIKKALKIPVIGSGDILGPQLAQEMLDNTGCDGVIVARGAFGNPWIFEQTEAYLKDSIPPSPLSYETIISVAKKHLKLYRDWKNSLSQKPPAEKYYVGHLRKIAMWYSKGLPYSKRAREAISKAATYDDIVKIMDRLSQDYDIAWLKR